jgi:serine/threonine protein kinase
MGEVCETEDSHWRQTAGLKTIRTGVGEREAVSEGFRREIQMARRVTHPNVCRIHDIAGHRPEEGGAPLLLLTMELLRGRRLRARMREEGPQPAERALAVIEQQAQGLAAAQAAGVVHGEFKPGNVTMVPLSGGVAKAVPGLTRGQAKECGRWRTSTSDSARQDLPFPVSEGPERRLP